MVNRRIAAASTLSAAAVGALARLGVAHGQQSVTGNQVLGGLIDVVVNNLSLLNNPSLLNNLSLLNNSLNDVDVLNNSPITVVLNDVLNGNQINVLSDILNDSMVLSGNTVVVQNVLNKVLQNVDVSLTNVDILKNFLNNNAVAIDRVVAVDVLSAPVTVYVFDVR